MNAKVQATRKITGTNPVTNRPKIAQGAGVVVATDLQMGFHGPVTVIRWANGVESYHCADDADQGYVTI